MPIKLVIHFKILKKIMQKPLTIANNSLALTSKASNTKSKNTVQTKSKKIGDKVLAIFNYQYKESDLEQFVF